MLTIQPFCTGNRQIRYLHVGGELHLDTKSCWFPVQNGRIMSISNQIIKSQMTNFLIPGHI